MASENIIQIAFESGDCPDCIVEKIEELGFNTFSSYESFKEKVLNGLPEARNPFYYTEVSDYVYFCNKHTAEASTAILQNIEFV